jgi:hypothetical protein
MTVPHLPVTFSLRYEKKSSEQQVHVSEQWTWAGGMPQASSWLRETALKSQWSLATNLCMC